MFERYTEQARRAIFFARYEASNAGSSSVGAEHLLLGALRGRTPGGAVLDDMRAEIEKARPRGSPVPTSMDLPVSPAARRALACAAKEAERLGHPHIGVEDLLLGLMVEDPESIAPGLLRKHGIDQEMVLRDFADVPVAEPVDREGLRALIDKLPERFLRPAKRMLEQMQAAPSVPPLVGGMIGGFGGGRAGSWGRPPGWRGHGRRSASRFEDGAEIVETHYSRDGHEIKVIERIRMSEDGKTLSYTQEISGPGRSAEHAIDFDVSEKRREES